MRSRRLRFVRVVGWVLAIAAGAACGTSDAQKGTPSGSAPPVGDAASADGGAPGTSPRPFDAGGDASDLEPADSGHLADAGFGDPTGATAVAVSAFLGSLGVCTHVAQGIDAPAQSATAMAYAGLRNLRDDGNPNAVSGWITMHQSAGVRVSLLATQGVTKTIDMAKTLNAAGALLAVEGPNEPNNFAVTYEGATSNAATFVPVAHLQRDLYAAVKAEVALTGVPVFHSSEAGGSEPDNVGLQFLTIPADAGTTMPVGTKYADYVNTHNYVCGHSSKLVDNVAWSASSPTLDGDWDGPYVEYGHTWHGGFTGYSNAELVTLPKVTTETGWVTTGTNAITEEQQARLFLDLYLAAYKQGFAYTFVYMLRDDPGQGYWGLFDTQYQPKKSGTYLHNLTTILADTGPATAPAKLDYAIANEPKTVHELLLQKHDGFALVVWNERPSGGSDAVTLDLGSVRTNVRVYDPTTGTAPTQTLPGARTVLLTLTDHPVVLVL